MDIILYLLQTIQDLYRQNCWLIHFICRYILLKPWTFDDSHSPKYQKFKMDQLPLVTDFRQDWTYQELIPYYEKRYGKKIRPSSVAQNAIFLTIAVACAVMPRNRFFTRITAPKASSSVRCAALKAASRPSSCSALTVEMLQGADNMPGKWQLLIFLGQQTILTMQKNGTAAPVRSGCQQNRGIPEQAAQPAVRICRESLLT